MAIVTIGVLSAFVPARAGAQAQPHQAERRATAPAIPESLLAEHTAIHAELVEATKAGGRVGEAARELAALLDPHFKRENEIALPPLGLLKPLAAGERPAGMKEALAMTDALRKELPRMLEEHKQIHAATEKLQRVAREEKDSRFEKFAEELAAHARSEEEVLYPAAILVGDVIRARLSSK